MKQLFAYYYRADTVQAEPAAPQLNLLHLNMIFALASIDHQRRSLPGKHPFGYFTAALNNFTGQLNFGTIEDIQGLLLIATFGQYYNIGMLFCQSISSAKAESALQVVQSGNCLSCVSACVSN